MLEYTDYIKIFIALLAVVDPLAAMPIIVPIEGAIKRLNLNHRRNDCVPRYDYAIAGALRRPSSVDSVGININLFNTSGGGLLMQMSLSMLQGKISETKRFKKQIFTMSRP